MSDERKRRSVLNNSYKTGEKLQGDTFEFYTSVKVDEIASSTFMRDSCNFDSIYYASIADEVRNLIETDEKLSEICGKYDDINNKKMEKEDINTVFEIIYDNFTNNKDFKYFFNVYYAISIVSDITNVGCDVIFNALAYENKMKVVEELFEDGHLIF